MSYLKTAYADKNRNRQKFCYDWWNENLVQFPEIVDSFDMQLNNFVQIR